MRFEEKKEALMGFEERESVCVCVVSVVYVCEKEVLKPDGVLKRERERERERVCVICCCVLKRERERERDELLRP